MDKPWLQEYPPGIPAEIEPTESSTLRDMLDLSCARFGRLPAFSSMGASLTYREFDARSRALACFLQSELHLQKGARIALMLPNLLQYPVALSAALRIGATVVNVNPLYTPRELEHQLRDSGATCIVVLENFAHTLEQVLHRTSIRAVITTRVGDLLPRVKGLAVDALLKYVKRAVPSWNIPGAISFPAALRLGGRRSLEHVELTRDDVAFLQYTGGTTGVAKGVVLTHGNIVSNIQQLGLWIAGNLRQGEETAVIPLPLYHVYALTSSLVFTSIGAHCVLIPNPRDLRSFIAQLRHIRTSVIIGVNTLYRALLDAPGFSKVDLSRLKVSAAGGMAVQRAVAERWKKATGVPIVEGYGLSESSPVLMSNRLDIQDWTGLIGLPLPSTEAAILDEQGKPLGPGEVGEVCVRGPQVMKQYWNRPDETLKVFTADGWFRTGDMGVADERGYFKITDRKKDMIIVSGFKVFPNEIEDVAMLHPDVLEAGAIGVPDPRSGEMVKLFVVKRHERLTEQDLLQHCRKHLTAYKVPKAVEFRTEPLPKTPIGKILRRELRPSAAQPAKEPAQPTAAGPSA